MEESANLNVSIPIVGVLNEQKKKIILDRFASSATAERFLQATGIKASSPLLRHTKQLLRRTMGSPELKERYINEEYYATVDYERNDANMLSLLPLPSQFSGQVVESEPEVKISLRPVVLPSVFQEIYEEDRVAKPEVPKPITAIEKETYEGRDYSGGRISSFLLNSQRGEQMPPAKELEYEELNVEDHILMQRIEYIADSNYQGAWCIGGLSHCEIVRRFLKKYVTSTSEVKSKAPFNEERSAVLKIAKEISNYKVFIVQEVLFNNEYTFFPITLNEVLPDHFREILRLFQLEDSVAVSHRLKMRVLLKYKDDAQQREIDEMASDIRAKLNTRFSRQVDHLIAQIIEAENTPLTSQAGSVLNQYYTRKLSKRVPTSVNGAEDYVSCKMDERMQIEVDVSDCLRYIEGFCTVFNFQYGNCASITSRLISNETAQLSLAMAEIFEEFYILPIYDLSQRNSHELKESYLEKINQTVGTKMEMSLRELHADEQGISIESFFESYAQKLEEEQRERMQKNPELVSALRRAFGMIRNTKFYFDIASEAGAQEFIKYLVDNNMSQQMSPQRFRAVRTQYLKEKTHHDANSRKIIEENAKYLQYQILSATVAAVKAVEEAFPLIVNSKLGEIEERRFKSQVWRVCDENGVLLRGLRDMYHNE